MNEEMNDARYTTWQNDTQYTTWHYVIDIHEPEAYWYSIGLLK